MLKDWNGLIAGTIGGVDRGRTCGTDGSLYLLGADPELILIFLAGVGGPLTPLASARAEATCMLRPCFSFCWTCGGAMVTK